MSEPKGVTLGMVALDLDEQADAMSEAIIPELLALTRQQAALVRAADRVVAAARKVAKDIEDYDGAWGHADDLIDTLRDFDRAGGG